MPELNICEKAELLTDEYFHGELSPEEKKMLQEHIKSCEKCAEFFVNEKIYFENLKSAEFTPEINISESVMNIIISKQIIIDKPAKKRFVPFGFISAAAVVLVILIASYDNLNLFEKTVNDSLANIKDGKGYSLTEADGSAQDYINNESGGGAEVFAVPQIRAMIETDEKTAEFEISGEYAEESAKELLDIYLEETEDNNIAPAAVIPEIKTASAIPAPGEIIKIKRGGGENQDFSFAEYIYIEESVFITKEYKNAMIEHLKIYGIYYEIENTGIESEYIKIIYID